MDTQPQLAWWQRLVERAYRYAVGDAIPTPSVTDDRRLGWVSMGSAVGYNDRPENDRIQGYKDALDAWRANPIARQIIALITDFIVTEQVIPSAQGDMGKFVERFWYHEENHMATRMPELMDELSRAGDLFITLFRNPIDGMSYVRPVPANQIMGIDVADNDWEKELAFYQRMPVGTEPRKWLSPWHPDAPESDAVMLHYFINKPVGALYGESELASILSWLKRYNRMLEDRVRLNFAARAFHWFVKVPNHKVTEKQAQYSTPPEPGAIIVHDDNEEWTAGAPALNASDARHDLEAIRRLIATGSGQPPFWHGDAGDVNLATARVMQEPALRRLQRRQEHTRQMITDLCYIAALRSNEVRRGRSKPKRSDITLQLADLTREDNRSLADAAKNVADGLTQLWQYQVSPSKTLSRRILKMIFSFAGDELSEQELNDILNETEFVYTPPDPFGGGEDSEEADETADEGKKKDDNADKPAKKKDDETKSKASIYSHAGFNGGANGKVSSRT